MQKHEDKLHRMMENEKQMRIKLEQEYSDSVGQYEKEI